MNRKGESFLPKGDFAELTRMIVQKVVEQCSPEYYTGGISAGYRQGLGMVIAQVRDLTSPLHFDWCHFPKWISGEGVGEYAGEQPPVPEVIYHSWLFEHRSSVIFTLLLHAERVESKRVGTDSKSILKEQLMGMGYQNHIQIPSVGILSCGCSPQDVLQSLSHVAQV